MSVGVTSLLMAAILVPISGTRLSDWLHRKAHGDKLTARGFGTVSNSPSPLDTARLCPRQFLSLGLIILTVAKVI
ncbi:MAG: hypothetical protein WBD96_19990, partial [Pseudolabrys sp.]